MRKYNFRDITGTGSIGTITTSYEGQYLGQIISAALLSGDTIDKGGITVKPNVKYKEVVKKLTSDNIVVDSTCDFTATADAIDMAERVLEVEPFQVNLQLCKKDFLSDYLALEMGDSAYKNLPNSFADFLMAHIASKVAEKQEQSIWRGLAANAGEFNGLTVLFAADADINDVASPVAAATGFTADNIIDELGKLVDTIPSAVYGKEDLHLYLPTNAFQKYVRALGGFGANGVGAQGVDNRGTMWYDNGGLTFEGIKVFKAPGMPTTDMVAAEVSNLYYGCALQSDMASAKILDMADLDGSDNVRAILRFQAGVQYGVGSDIAYYHQS